MDGRRGTAHELCDAALYQADAHTWTQLGIRQDRETTFKASVLSELMHEMNSSWWVMEYIRRRSERGVK